MYVYQPATYPIKVDKMPLKPFLVEKWNDCAFIHNKPNSFNGVTDKR